ncbi:hypothetical protein FJ364_00745 [Candidatus Dependentiae bacterium]|nr:hypothetical protein [Candidatus Dependentiae bacterium]
MHIDLNIVSILFRGAIFFLFAYKVYQNFIKDKLRAYLHTELQNERNEQIELVEKDTLLLSTRKRLEGQLNQQKQVFTTLEKKYAHFVFLEQQAAAEQEKMIQIRIHTIKQKRELQQKNLATLVALRLAVPEAIEAAKHELMQEYNESRSRNVLNEYLKKMA